jgi:hypothetical protein
VDYAKNRGIRPNAQRQRKNGNQSDGGILPQRPKGVS